MSQMLHVRDIVASFDVRQHSFDNPLCRIMASFGTDKGGPWHNYGLLYHALFEGVRHADLNLFEFGVGPNRGSILGWEQYFSKARIYAADIDRTLLFQTPRTSCFFVDQTDPATLDALFASEALRDVQFDIIIDDGLHTPAANMQTFHYAYERLRDGGVYIIEDVMAPYLDTMRAFCSRVQRTLHPQFADVLCIPNDANVVDNNLVIFWK